MRELENAVERMGILSEPNNDLIAPELLPAEIRPLSLDGEVSVQQGKPSQGVKTMKDAYEKMILLEALMKHDWNQSAAARELEIDEKKNWRPEFSYVTGGCHSEKPPDHFGKISEY